MLLKAIFLAVMAIQVAVFSDDAREWCLWLPGLAICGAGLLAERRAYLSGGTLFWMVCLFLYVVAPASQLCGDYFQGPISVIGIRFPDEVIMRAVTMGDAFLASALLVQLIMRRRTTMQIDRLDAAGAPDTPRSPLPATGPSEWSAAPGQPEEALEPVANADDQQLFVMVDDEAEFRNLRAVEDPEAQAAAEEAEAAAMQRGAATDHGISADDQQLFVMVDDEAEFRNLRAVEDAAPTPSPAPPPAEAAAEAEPIDDPVVRLLQSRGLALIMLVGCVGMLAAVSLLTGGFDFITNGRSYSLRAFADNLALGTFVNSFIQDLQVVWFLVGSERFLRRRSAANLALLVVLLGFMLLFVNPLNTARYQFGAVLVMSLLFLWRGRIPVALSYVGIVAYLYVVMPLMNLLRYGLAEAQDKKVAVGIDYNQLDYDCFSMFAFAVYRTGIEGFTYGKYLISSALFFLPRSWWPDKPKSSANDLGEYLMRHHSGWFDNLSCPPMGDGYLDFGIAGVLSIGVLFGYLLERGDRVIDGWRRMSFLRRGLAAALVAFIPILLRGSLGAVIGFVLAPAFVLIAVWMVARAASWFGSPRTLPGMAWDVRGLHHEK